MAKNRGEVSFGANLTTYIVADIEIYQEIILKNRAGGNRFGRRLLRDESAPFSILSFQCYNQTTVGKYHPDDDYDEKIEKMVTLTVAGAKGIVPLTQVTLPLAQIVRSQTAPPEARELAQRLSRILRGERDPITLAEGFSPQFAAIVQETLAQIEAPLPELEQSERQEISFEQLVEKVAEACSGDMLLWQQLWQFTEELATDHRVPPKIQHLGHVLRQILAGERQKHILDRLSEEHRWAVEQLLDWLNAQAVEPGSAHEQPETDE